MSSADGTDISQSVCSMAPLLEEQIPRLNFKCLFTLLRKRLIAQSECLGYLSGYKPFCEKINQKEEKKNIMITLRFATNVRKWGRRSETLCPTAAEYRLVEPHSVMWSVADVSDYECLLKTWRTALFSKFISEHGAIRHLCTRPSMLQTRWFWWRHVKAQMLPLCTMCSVVSHRGQSAGGGSRKDAYRGHCRSFIPNSAGEHAKLNRRYFTAEDNTRNHTKGYLCQVYRQEYVLSSFRMVQWDPITSKVTLLTI